MNKILAGPKDFWIGLIYLLTGLAGLYFGWDYKFGTAGRMGPGYFPLVLSWLLVAFGLISIVRSVLVKGEPVSEIQWLPMVLIMTAVVAFAFLLPRVGSFISLSALVLISALASNEFKFDVKSMLGMFGVVALCTLVFVNGLGVPMPDPIFGSVFNGIAKVLKATIGAIPVAVLTVVGTIATLAAIWHVNRT
jgi:hypothetical protein